MTSWSSLGRRLLPGKAGRQAAGVQQWSAGVEAVLRDDRSAEGRALADGVEAIRRRVMATDGAAFATDTDKMAAALLAWLKVALADGHADCDVATVDSALQFAVALCLVPNVARGVGRPLSSRLSDARLADAFGHFVPALTQSQCGNGDTVTEVQRAWLAAFVECLAPAVSGDGGGQRDSATLVRRKYLSDYFAALLQLINSADAPPASRSHRRRLLKSAMASCGTAELFAGLLPLLFNARSPTDAAPRWLRADCAALLARCLAKPAGFTALVHSLGDAGALEADWRRCTAVGRLVAAVPQSQAAHARAYVGAVCEQLLALLAARWDSAGRLCAACVDALCAAHPQWAAAELIGPLFAPFDRRPLAQIDAALGGLAALCDNFPPPHLPDAFALRLASIRPTLLFVMSRTSLDKVHAWRRSAVSCIGASLAHDHFACDRAAAARRRVGWLVAWAAGRSDCALWSTGEVLVDGQRLSLRCDSDTDKTVLCDQDVDAVRKEKIDVALDVLIDADQAGAEGAGATCSLLLASLDVLDALQDDKCDSGDKVLVCLAVVEAVLDRLGGVDLEQCPTAAVTRMAMTMLERSDSRTKRNYEGGGRLRELDEQCAAVAVAALGAQLAQLREGQLSSSELCRMADLCAGVAEHSSLAAGTRRSAAMLHQLLQSLLGEHHIAPSTSKAGGQSEAAPSAGEPAADRFDLDEALATLADGDESPALRGGALIQIARRLKRPADVHAVMARFDEVLAAASGALCDADSYVYLSAVRALATLALLRTDVLPLLVDDLVADCGGRRTVETRLNAGECVAAVCKRLGDVAPVHARRLTGAFLRLARTDEEHSRASALSNLAELAAVAPHALLADINEILYCLECNLAESNAPVCRRAALHLLRSLLDGAGGDMLQVLGAGAAPLYRRCRTVAAGDGDPVARLHAQLCLEQFDRNMKQAMAERRPLVTEL